ncbi:DUF5304 domain-containing protein [Streptomyces sp. JJ38]|uniref:DUF5304 domain-containing protein n=1 Tax=Streptomyces sp. JJ38 TaxID=2738128 RepID=UPI001C57F7FD|nr:DUF5304 domain-containing protein [Streptomyces sp. JJ38]MBW1599153.1 DUF5304 domain-containing protein [Streptomyces sp. JJ38]
MSDATERDADARRDPHEPAGDAWAGACAEDLAAERERRREKYGPQPGSAAEELRRLAESVAGRLAEITAPLAGQAFGAAGQGERWARQLVEGARSAVEPVVERNPQVFEHLAAAGNELLAAYRSAVTDAEQRWTRRPDGQRPPGEAGKGAEGDGGEEPPGAERIDLD